MVGAAARLAQRLRQELAGPDQHPGDPGPLRRQYVRLHVVPDHHRPVRGHPQPGQRRLEEGRRGLPRHLRLGPRRPLKAHQEGPGVQLQPLVGAPVQVPVHRDQPRPALEVPEGPVQLRVPELLSGAPDDDDIGRLLDERHPLQVLRDVPAVQQRAPRPREVLGEMCRRHRGRRQDVLGRHREPRIRQRPGDGRSRPRGRVGDERDPQPGPADLPQGLDRAGERLPGDGEDTVDVDEHGTHGFHARTIATRMLRESQGAIPTPATRLHSRSCAADIAGHRSPPGRGSTREA